MKSNIGCFVPTSSKFYQKEAASAVREVNFRRKKNYKQIRTETGKERMPKNEHPLKTWTSNEYSYRQVETNIRETNYSQPEKIGVMAINIRFPDLYIHRHVFVH